MAGSKKKRSTKKRGSLVSATRQTLASPVRAGSRKEDPNRWKHMRALEMALIRQDEVNLKRAVLSQQRALTLHGPQPITPLPSKKARAAAKARKRPRRHTLAKPAPQYMERTVIGVTPSAVKREQNYRPHLQNESPEARDRMARSEARNRTRLEFEDCIKKRKERAREQREVLFAKGKGGKKGPQNPPRRYMRPC